jgi:hypothetical protein
MLSRFVAIRSNVGQKRMQYKLHLVTLWSTATAIATTTTTTTLLIAVFWIVAPFSLVHIYQRFRGPCCLHHHGAQMMEAARTSETLVNFYQTTWSYNPEDSHLHTHCCENLKSSLTTLLCCIVILHNFFKRCKHYNHISIVTQRKTHVLSLTWQLLITWNGNLLSYPLTWSFQWPDTEFFFFFKFCNSDFLYW